MKSRDAFSFFIVSAQLCIVSRLVRVLVRLFLREIACFAVHVRVISVYGTDIWNIRKGINSPRSKPILAGWKVASHIFLVAYEVENHSALLLHSKAEVSLRLHKIYHILLCANLIWLMIVACDALAFNAAKSPPKDWWFKMMNEIDRGRNDQSRLSTSRRNSSFGDEEIWISRLDSKENTRK